MKSRRPIICRHSFVDAVRRLGYGLRLVSVIGGSPLPPSKSREYRVRPAPL
jgi:hypothetical protein